MEDLFDMTGKTVVFTGGCGNLGHVMVKALLDYGANVAVPSRTDRFDESFDTYKKDGKLFFVYSDMRETQSIRDAFAAIAEKFGEINVLVNCAAYGGGAGGKSCEFHIDKMDDETWFEGVDGTLGLVFRCIREVLPYFDKAGGGNIVNIGSMHALVAPDFEIYGDTIPWNPPTYGPGKAGVLCLTRYCASVLAKRHIRCNALTPGCFPVVGPNSDQGFIQRLGDRSMMKRVGLPEELNGPILLLCSDASSFMTGYNLVVDGGITAW